MTGSAATREALAVGTVRLCAEKRDRRQEGKQKDGAKEGSQQQEARPGEGEGSHLS